MAEDNKMVENNGGWQPSDRLKKLAEKTGFVIPEIKVEDTAIKPSEKVEWKAVVATPEEVEEMREAKKESIRVIFEKSKSDTPLEENEKRALESYQKSQKDILESLDTLLSEGDTKTDDYGVRYHKAKDVLGSFGVEVNAYIKDRVEGSVEVGKRKKELLHVVDKMVKEEGLSVEEKVIAEKVGLHKVGLVNFEEDKTPTVMKSEDVKIEKKDLPEMKEKRKTDFRNIEDIKTEEDVQNKINKIYEETKDYPSLRLGDLNKLRKDLGDRMGNKGRLAGLVVNEISKLNKKSYGIEGLPETDEDWVKRVRADMVGLLVPSEGDTKGVNEIFKVISTSEFQGKVTRTQVNVTDSMEKKELRENLIDGEKSPDGRLIKTSELQVVQEMGRLYNDWRKTHSRLNAMVETVDGAGLKTPSNALNKRLLNDLGSEDGTDPEGGSKNIAKAIQIYWAMAHAKEAEGIRVLEDNGLLDIANKSIFNHKFSIEEVAEIRGEIAKRCNGTFYENIGLIYSGFLGITAYGSDNPAAGSEYADAMGNLIYTEGNRYANESDKNNPSRRAGRFLHDTVANGLIVVRNGKAVVNEKRVYPVRLSFYLENAQIKNENINGTRSFYVLREKGSEKYRVVNKLNEEGKENFAVDPKAKDPVLNTDRYEETSLVKLVKEGRINEIDWGKSDDMFAKIASREKSAVGVYKLYKNLDDDLAKMDTGTLIARKDTFDSALPLYNTETKQNAMYLWLYSLISKNGDSWTKNDKLGQLKNVIDSAVKEKLISDSHKKIILDKFNLHWYR